jgi:hypothetical protein
VVRHASQWAYEAITFRRTLLSATEASYPLYLRLDCHPTGTFMGCLPRRHIQMKGQTLARWEAVVPFNPAEMAMD